MGENAYVDIDAHTEKLDAKVEIADKKLDATAEKQLKTQRSAEIKWIALAEVGSRILRTFEDSVAAQVAVKSIEIAQFGLSIRRIGAEAIAAATLHQWAQASTLGWLVISMTALKVESELQAAKIRQEQTRVQNIRLQMESYL